MKSPPRELEIKLELPAEHLRRLKKAAIEGTTEYLPSSAKQLSSAYYDTRGRVLRRHGYSLRVREVDGGWIQTLKAGRTIRGGVSNPIEIEAEIGGPKPRLDAIDDKDIRDAIESLIGKSRLVALFDTEIRRTSRHLETATGDRIELSIDEGHVATRPVRRDVKPKKSAIREVELELKAGSIDGLVSVLEEITSQSEFRLSDTGKADIGYRLLDETPAPPEVAKARPPDIDSQMSGSAALGKIVETAAAQALANWHVVLDRNDPEGVHQMRVGLRRLRSALRILRYALDDQAFVGLAAELRDLAQAAGEVRDLDVLATDLLEPIAATVQFAAGLEEIRARLDAERLVARRKLLDRLQERRSEMLRVRLGLLPHLISNLPASSVLGEPVEQLAATAVTKLTNRALKRGKDIESATVEQRHELRKALKAIRYAAEFFGPVYHASKLQKLAKSSAKLQDLLGYHNDVALAGRLTTLPRGKSRRHAEIDLAIGAVIGWHSARDAEALQQIGEAWKSWRKLAKEIAAE